MKGTRAGPRSEPNHGSVAVYLLAVPLGIAVGSASGTRWGRLSPYRPSSRLRPWPECPGRHHGFAGHRGGTALAAHARAGKARIVSGLLFGGLGIAGSSAGARLSSGASSDVPVTAVAGLFLVAAATMVLRNGRSGQEDSAAGRRTPDAIASLARRPRRLARTWAQSGEPVSGLPIVTPPVFWSAIAGGTPPRLSVGVPGSLSGHCGVTRRERGL